MSRCAPPAGSDAPEVEVLIIGPRAAAGRRQKRRTSAGGAGGGRRARGAEHLRDDVRAAELGARRGPLVLLNGIPIADGAEPVETIQARLHLAHEGEES
ncbi:MAG: hypothetical protein DSZ01_06880 [Gammaproteobacteria bacterium]|nr:MAG: hypothetical protein DSZ01_06880 [Gammaproteobacteria bacterium]